MGLLLLFAFISTTSLPGAEAYLAGLNAENEGNYKQAAAHYLKLSEISSPLTPYSQVRAAYSRCHYEDSNASLEELIRLASEPDEPWEFMAQVLLATVFMERAMHSEAEEVFEKVFSQFPKPWWLDDYEWTAAKNMLHIPEKRNKGLNFFNNFILRFGDPSKKYESSLILAEHSKHSDILVQALQFLHSGKYKSTVSTLTPFINKTVINDDYLQSILLYSGELFTGITGSREGLPFFRTLAELLPGTRFERKSLVHAVRMATYAGKLDISQQICEELIQKYPTTGETADTLWLHAKALERRGLLKDAASTYSQLVETNPKNWRAPQAMLRAGYLYFRSGEPQKSLARFEKIIEIDTQNKLQADIYYWIGRAFESLGKSKEALEAYKSVSNGRFGEFYVQLANHKIKSANNNLFVIKDYSTATSHKITETELPESIVKSPEYMRLIFFTAHGLEEGDWEAWHLVKSMQKELPERNVFMSLCEAGHAYTAIRLARTGKWNLVDGKKELSKYVLDYPPAFLNTVYNVANETGIDPFLILSITRQESAFRTTIVSGAGAKGLMQLMPATAEWVAEMEPAVKKETAVELFRPENSFRLGAYYLKRMLSRYKDDVVFALAAYNAGPGNVDKWLKKTGKELSRDEFIESIPYEETRRYVKSVLGAYYAYRKIYTDLKE